MVMHRPMPPPSGYNVEVTSLGPTEDFSGSFPSDGLCGSYPNVRPHHCFRLPTIRELCVFARIEMPLVQASTHSDYSSLSTAFRNALTMFWRLGCSRIIAQVWTVHDARVLIGEWLLGFGVDEQPFGLSRILQFRTLSNLGTRPRLRAERIVKCMSRVRVFRHFDITACCRSRSTYALHAEIGL